MHNEQNNQGVGQPIDPASGYIFDPVSGMYLHQHTGMYYEPNSGFFYDPKTGYYIDPKSGYYFHQQSGLYYDPKSQMWYDPNAGKWFTPEAEAAAADDVVVIEDPDLDASVAYVEYEVDPASAAGVEADSVSEVEAGADGAVQGDEKYESIFQPRADAELGADGVPEGAVAAAGEASDVKPAASDAGLGVADATDAGDDAESRAGKAVEDTVILNTISQEPVWELQLQDGEIIPLKDFSVVLGRRPGDGNITIPDPDKTMSKQHARISLSGDTMLIEDLGSTNGTLVVNAFGESNSIEPHTPVPFFGPIVLGTVQLTVRIRA